MMRGGASKRMADLVIGDEILTVSNHDTLEYSPVVYLPHGPNHVPATFIEVRTESQAMLRVTADHLVVSSPECDLVRPFTTRQLGKQLVTAGSLNVSHCLVTAVNGELRLEKIEETKLVHREGIYTAVTKNPYLVCSNHSPVGMWYTATPYLLPFVLLVVLNRRW